MVRTILDSVLVRCCTKYHEYTRSHTPVTKTSRVDQREARWSEQRASEASRRRERIYVKEEADDERDGEEKNCRSAKSEMGEGQTVTRLELNDPALEL